MINMSIIEVSNLSKRYGDFLAVDSVSFNIDKGETFGFLGPNGAGKTTTINMLCTLISMTSGNARIAGFDVNKEPLNVRRSIGLVFQDPSLDERLTAVENLRFHGRVYSVPSNVREQRINEMLNYLELSDWKDSIVREFSGGMKRRLEIARGLIHYPQVLFLDEPTLGLDPQTRNKIWEHIKYLQKEKEITVFLTTHYMEEAENCSRIAIIDHGKIIALGTPQELKSKFGGDILTLNVEDSEEAKKILIEKYKFKDIMHDGDKLEFEVTHGEKFIPGFIKEFPFKVNSISLRKPTLEDVFISLTGRVIREGSANAAERMKTMKLAWSGRRR